MDNRKGRNDDSEVDRLHSYVLVLALWTFGFQNQREFLEQIKNYQPFTEGPPVTYFHSYIKTEYHKLIAHTNIWTFAAWEYDYLIIHTFRKRCQSNTENQKVCSDIKWFVQKQCNNMTALANIIHRQLFAVRDIDKQCRLLFVCLFVCLFLP